LVRSIGLVDVADSGERALEEQGFADGFVVSLAEEEGVAPADPALPTAVGLR
jgi:hypothetical protein